MEIKSPKIVASSKNNIVTKKKPFVKRETKFKSNSELQAYLVDSVAKNKNNRFNMKISVGLGKV